jgi:hypothetical protein
MSQLIRLIYASRSTFEPNAAHQGLDPSIAKILAKSRKNNAQRGIVGSLLFGDGCFLQCLEGSDEAVDALYEKIKADPRHGEVTVLSRRNIDHASFRVWSMKYAPGEAPLRQLMKSLGMNRFDPYAMSPQNIEVTVAYMEREAESGLDLQCNRADGSDAPAVKLPVSFIDTFKSGGATPAGGSALAAASSAGKSVKLVAALTAVAALLGWGYFYFRA